MLIKLIIGSAVIITLYMTVLSDVLGKAEQLQNMQESRNQQIEQLLKDM